MTTKILDYIITTLEENLAKECAITTNLISYKKDYILVQVTDIQKLIMHAPVLYRAQVHIKIYSNQKLPELIQKVEALLMNRVILVEVGLLTFEHMHSALETSLPKAWKMHFNSTIRFDKPQF